MTPATVQDVTTLRRRHRRSCCSTRPTRWSSAAAPGDQTGKGQLYYTAHLKTYQPVEQVGPLNRGVSVNREYRLADCGQTIPEQTCPTITQAKVGDVIRVKLTVVVPNSLYYVIVEDPLPAGAEASIPACEPPARRSKGRR